LNRAEGPLTQWRPFTKWLPKARQPLRLVNATIDTPSGPQTFTLDDFIQDPDFFRTARPHRMAVYHQARAGREDVIYQVELDGTLQVAYVSVRAKQINWAIFYAWIESFLLLGLLGVLCAIVNGQCRSNRSSS
jgi:hypothetical protein